MGAQPARLTLILADGEPACYSGSVAARTRIVTARLAALADATSPEVVFDLACEALRGRRVEIPG
jgi:hypothetical protein